MTLKLNWIFTLVCLLTLEACVTPQKGQALSCGDVNKLTKEFFARHLEYDHYTNELSKRTLDRLIKIWDPGKMYFLKSDVDSFTKKYATKIDDLVKRKKCTHIDDIFSVYTKRYKEVQPIIDKYIEQKHDFTIDEYITIDSDKIDFSPTSAEREERWRKRVKFQIKEKKSSVKMAKAKTLLKKRYKLARKRNKEIDYDKVIEYFLSAFSSSLDPHTDYMSPDQLESFRINTKLSLDGIGALLRAEDGFTVIQRLVPGGAAAKTKKIKNKDKIIAVGQGKSPPVDIIDMDLNEVVKLIRGKGGTTVMLTILRETPTGNKRLNIPVIREKIQLNDRAAKSAVIKTDYVTAAGAKTPYKVGVVHLPSFYIDFQARARKIANYRSSTKDVLREIEKIKKTNKLDALIVDLRNNGGGALDESVDLTGLFIKKGPVVQIKGSGSTMVHEDNDAAIYYTGPLVVLINKQSASASEIFAGAIKDYKRGLIVGDKSTFGKGTVQNLVDISPEVGAMKVTISKFYRPLGSSTQLNGVPSDITIPSITDSLEIGEKYYDYALTWKKVRPKRFKQLDQMKVDLKTLGSRSQARALKDENFAETREAIAEYNKKKSESSRISLKEEKDDKKDDEAEEEEFDYNTDITLKNDPVLQETVRIAVDYSRALKKQSLAGNVQLPHFEGDKNAKTTAGKSLNLKNK